jgi:hypothetical protein
MFACVRLNMIIEQVYSIKHFLSISVDKTHQIRRESYLGKKNLRNSNHSNDRNINLAIIDIKKIRFLIIYIKIFFYDDRGFVRV